MKMTLSFINLAAVLPLTQQIDCSFVCSSMTITEDIAVCNYNCNLKDILLFSVIALFCLSALLCLICCCMRKRFCNTIAKLIIQLREEKDHPLPGENTAEFKENCVLLMQALESSKEIKNFYFKVGEEKTYIKVNKCSLEGETNNLKELSFEGDTQIAKFKAKGSLLQGESDKIWFLAWFKPAAEGKRAGMPELMIFEGGLSGGYSYRGNVTDADTKEMKGTWTILAKQPESTGGLAYVSALTCFDSKI